MWRAIYTAFSHTRLLLTQLVTDCALCTLSIYLKHSTTNYLYYVWLSSCLSNKVSEMPVPVGLNCFVCASVINTMVFWHNYSTAKRCWCFHWRQNKYHNLTSNSNAAFLPLLFCAQNSVFFWVMISNWYLLSTQGHRHGLRQKVIPLKTMSHFSCLVCNNCHASTFDWSCIQMNNLLIINYYLQCK